MTTGLIRRAAGVFMIVVGAALVIVYGLASMNILFTPGPLTIFGIIGGVCAIITGVRSVRVSTSLEAPSSAEEHRPLS